MHSSSARQPINKLMAHPVFVSEQQQTTAKTTSFRISIIFVILINQFRYLRNEYYLPFSEFQSVK